MTPLAQRALLSLPPELAHQVTLAALKTGAVRPALPPTDARLAVTLGHLQFPNPLGLAAGFDKRAEVINPLFKLGFGAVEVGSVTPLPQPGNPKPRVFRAPDHDAVINRYGFPSAGLAPFVGNLQKFRAHANPAGILGINLGKNKTSTDPVADYVIGIMATAAYADYLVVNISSPNTPGLRALQNKDALLALLQTAQRTLAALPLSPRPLLLVKIAPDLTDEQLADIAAIALQLKLDGIILGNTTMRRPDALPPTFAAETGGLSGRPLFESSTRLLHELYRATDGAIPLVGVGGIMSGADAWAKIQAGASLVQVYTGLIYKGPWLIQDVLRELSARCTAEGYSSIAAAVGQRARG